MIDLQHLVVFESTNQIVMVLMFCCCCCRHACTAKHFVLQCLVITTHDSNICQSGCVDFHKLLLLLQTCMYGQACVDDNPYLGRWLVVMGLTSQALEIWSLYATLDSTTTPAEIGNVLMCTCFILPLFNTVFSVIFVSLFFFFPPLLISCSFPAPSVLNLSSLYLQWQPIEGECVLCAFISSWPSSTLPSA